MFRFVDIANGLTTASLLAAFTCAAYAVKGQTGASMIALVVSGLCDLFDGLVARRLSRDTAQQRFGSSLDSIVDGCAFGFAPSVMLYCARTNGPLEVLLLAALPVCVVWRVAYFDVVGLHEEAQSRYYTGLPATYVALVLPLVAMLGFIAEPWFHWGNNVALVCLCVAMMSSFPIRKPSGFAYGFFLLLAMGVLVVLLAFGSLLPTAMAN